MRRVVLTGLFVVFATLLAVGCVMPNGEQVVVDRRGGDVWSGSAVLLVVGGDGRCRVAVRTPALFVEKRWVDCRYVHSRPAL
jgi:hypothetical protein